MSISRKPDSDEIKAFLGELKIKPWLGPARLWWPDFLFRFDNLVSAAKILNSGKLLARSKAIESGVMTSDSASPGVIGSTPDRWLGYARLYFRPRTPTQFRNEGFRPKDSLSLGAHCPIPIVMLFKSLEILTRSDAIFSDGNLASSIVKTGNDIKFLKSIPFEDVYHDTACDEEEKRSIIFHRHAEVAIHNELDLSSLSYIFCRTQAELETLLSHLDPSAKVKYASLLGAKANLHFRRWSFIELAELSNKEVHFKFNPSSKTPGPFIARVEILEDNTNILYSYESKSFYSNSDDSTFKVSLEKLQYPDNYWVSLFLDGNLAYKNHFEGEGDIPF